MRNISSDIIKAECAEMVGDKLRRFDLPIAELRILVDVMPDLGDLHRQPLDLGIDPLTLGIRRGGAGCNQNDYKNSSDPHGSILRLDFV